MTSVAAGEKFVVFRPVTYWAYLGVTLPSPRLPYGGAWPSGWNLIKDTANGLAITKRSPTVAITSEERDRIGSVKGDGGGVAIGLQLRTLTGELWDLVSNHDVVAVAADPGSPGATPPVPATPAFEVAHVNTGQKKNFMLGFEGLAVAGSLFDVDTLVRGVAYSVENTQDASDTFRETGADALLQPTLTLEAIPAIIANSQVTGTGIPMAALDPNRKFDYFRASVA